MHRRFKKLVVLGGSAFMFGGIFTVGTPQRLEAGPDEGLYYKDSSGYCVELCDGRPASECACGNPEEL